MKKILGLDLGTTSLGWAYVHEAEDKNEISKIIKTGVRVIPITTDENDDFQKGKSMSVNADRTLKRGMRRNIDRYQLRRENLIKVLKDNKIINSETVLTEYGAKTTHQTWEIRSKAVDNKVTLEEFARILLAINKKRGYKSNRKAKDEGDGQSIDGMDVAKYLYMNNITPGEYVYQRLKKGKKNIPEFYRSDLIEEFDKIWNNQKQYYPDILIDKLKNEIIGKNKGKTWSICKEGFNIEGIKLKGKRDEIKLQQYELRVKGLKNQLDLEHLLIVLQEINGQINSSSGYLGEISDRSKELYFKKITVGQYLYNQIKANPHSRLKNQVFYRQDYMDEFDKIWEKQSQYYDVLTDKLKDEIRNKIIFYQRRLKSQKGLLSICELEGKEVEIMIGGEKKKKIIGPRVIPKSSPLFQEYKIWQILNNIIIRNYETNEQYYLDDENKKILFEELNLKGKLTDTQVLNLIVDKPKEWQLNYKDGIEGNKTNQTLYKAYQNILIASGHNIDISKMKTKKIKEAIKVVFESLGINTDILNFDSDLKGKEFIKQPAYQLWHLLYSYEGDNSLTGNERLYKKLKEKFGFKREYAKFLVSVVFQDDYGNLGAKAIKKILPYMKEGHEYSEAASLAGYRHSKKSLTKEEIKSKVLLDRLELLPKNSLRNPVVEKILNQMVNLVNAIIDEYGRPDEIRIELARELKKSAKERKEMTENISKANKEYERIRNVLKEIPPFNSGVRITRNDIIKYRLYQELTNNGYKTIYTKTYIPLEKLYTKEFDIEHIIPKALLFDDSFSNKTLAVREFNRVKSSLTGIDAIIEKYGKDSDGYKNYIDGIENLYKNKAISRAKYLKLKMKQSEIPDGFIERDLRNSQYIAKKAKEMLESISRRVITTSGKVTSKLREDWQLINVLQELNWDKYNKLGLTYYEVDKGGKKIPKIKDWTKRNDHRHHAMDAITIAFTKHSHIQYLNNLNARKDKKNEKFHSVYGIEQKETEVNERGKRVIKPPMPLNKLRNEVKEHLDKTLISFKAKNKVVTKNKNKTKKKGGYNIKTELTPRGQLHKETIYGTSKYYVTKYEKIGTKFDEEKIFMVAKKEYRNALLKRLREFENNPKKAFGGKNSISKNPIFLDEEQSEKVPDKVKLVWLENRFTIRKEITPDNFKTRKNIEKVIDTGARKKMLERFEENNNDSKKAFSNLEENPIWLSKEKGIKLKSVSISGVSNAVPLHHKRNNKGKEILDKNGKPFPADYVSLGNNHHVAIYRDENGNLQEEVVSFFEAVARAKTGTPIINKNHEKGWEFLFSMKQNEMFVFPNEETGFDPKEIDLMDENNYDQISPNLFRVQKFTIRDYFFRHHFETNVDNINLLKSTTWKRLGLSGLLNVVKVRMNHLGKIVSVGEY